jgi:hypothetical protein
MLKTEGEVWTDANIKSVPVIDEFWHYPPKNSINFGLGWLYVPKKGRLVLFYGKRDQ